MQKFTLIALFTAIVLSACSTKEQGFTINGVIDHAQKEQIYLVKPVDGDYKNIDSTQLNDKGEFVFSGNVAFPEVYYIKVGQERGIPVFVENSKITFKATLEDLQNATIEGSAVNAEFKAINDELKLYSDAMNTMYQEYSAFEAASNKAGMDSIDVAYEAKDKEMKDFLVAKVKTNSASHVSPFIVTRMLGYRLELNELEEITNNFDAKLEGNVYLAEIKARVEILKKVAVGQPAPEITMMDTNGKPFSLSSLKGKVVLVDFWASWCNPCRAENPNVVKLYADFKGKGFDILGVSLDEDSASWIKAIADDKLTWNHVSDIKGWNNEAAKLYGVRSIPHTTLVDANGIIVAHSLRGEELRAKVAEMLK